MLEIIKGCYIKFNLWESDVTVTELKFFGAYSAITFVLVQIIGSISSSLFDVDVTAFIKTILILLYFTYVVLPMLVLIKRYLSSKNKK